MVSSLSLRTGLATLLVTILPAAGADDRLTPEPDWQYRIAASSDSAIGLYESPDANSAQVGSLQPNDQNIVVSGKAIEDGPLWWEIKAPSAPDVVGWVEARHLVPQEGGATRERGYPLQCRGAEPFWSLQVSRNLARFSSPDQGELQWRASDWLESAADPYHFAVRLEGSDGVGHLAILRLEGACSDRMSEFHHPFHTVLIRPNGEVLGGCCIRDLSQ